MLLIIITNDSIGRICPKRMIFFANVPYLCSSMATIVIFGIDACDVRAEQSNHRCCHSYNKSSAWLPASISDLCSIEQARISSDYRIFHTISRCGVEGARSANGLFSNYFRLEEDEARGIEVTLRPRNQNIDPDRRRIAR